MWLLKDNNGKITYLRANETFTVGRKTGDLVVSDDSVSRNHAVITVTKNEGIGQIENNAEPTSICKIKDTGSKYGSYILREKAPELRVRAQGNSLQHMDKIRFGTQNSIFVVIYVPIITATSGLDKNEKNKLRSIIDAIDGSIAVSWNASCSHMTISKPTISEKFTCALACGIPIVSIDFWQSVLEAFEANEELPDYKKFTKPIDRKLGLLGNISVIPDPRRKMVFQNLTFVHYDSGQYNMHKRMIETAGGKSVLCGNSTLKDIDVCDDNVIVVQLIESNTTQATGTGDANYMAACEKLGKCRRRAIPSCEIALAIFHCSTKKCCNPKYDHARMFRNSGRDYSDTSSVLALDTQDVDVPPGKSAIKPSSGMDVIKESIEHETPINSKPEAIQKETRDKAEATVDYTLQTVNPQKSRRNDSPYDSASEFDEASLKVSSLNYEKYAIRESNVDEESYRTPTKRGRDEQDDNDDITRKRGRGLIFTSPTNGGKDPSEDDDAPPVVATIPDKSGNIIQNNPSTSESEEQKITKTLLASETDSDQKLRETVSDRISASTSKDQSSLKETDSSARAPNWLSREVAKSPTRQSKTTRSSPFKKPERGQPTLIKFLSPKKNATEEVESKPTEKSNRKRDFITSNASSSSIAKTSIYNRGSCTTGHTDDKSGLNTSVQPLLRMDVSTDSFGLSDPKFGKHFRKGYTTRPRRIEYDNFIDSRSWSKDKTVSPAEGTKLTKISPASAKKKFRV